jgi:osmotically inducible protein OsmC
MFMAIRTATAAWQGALRGGHGTMQAGVGCEGPYSFASRFEEGAGSNPELLIGAAHAGCFSMALAGELEQAGYAPASVETTARVHLNKVETGFGIMRIDLITRARVPGIDNDTFQRLAIQAKVGCPVSRALAAVPEITLDAQLEG